ncbi:MAG: hypothetical protein ACI89L_000557 [Phycisphaerales bacterium]|jgi:hypothetical protein
MLRCCCAIGMAAVLSASASGQVFGVRDHMVVFEFEGTVDEIQVNSVGDAVWQIEEGTLFGCSARSYWIEPEWECSMHYLYTVDPFAFEGVRLGGFLPGEKGWPCLSDGRNTFLYYEGDLNASAARAGDGIGAAFTNGAFIGLWYGVGGQRPIPSAACCSPERAILEIGAVTSTVGSGFAFWGRTVGEYNIDNESRYGFIVGAYQSRTGSPTPPSQSHGLEIQLDDGGMVFPARVLLMNGQGEMLIGGPYRGPGERYATRGSLSVLSADGARLVAVDGTPLPGFEGDDEIWNLPFGGRPLSPADFALSERGEVVFRADLRIAGKAVYESTYSALRSLLSWKDGELKSLWEPKRRYFSQWPGTETAVARFDRDGQLYTRVWGSAGDDGSEPGVPKTPNRVWQGAPGEGTVIYEEEPNLSLLHFRFAEDLRALVFDDIPNLTRSREQALWAIDVDPATADSPRRLLGSGDVVETMDGGLRTIGNFIELAGVTPTGFITAVVEFADGGSGVVRFEMRAGVADMNGDGVIDHGDIGAFVEAFLAGRGIADINRDRVLDLADLDAFIAEFVEATGG